MELTKTTEDAAQKGIFNNKFAWLAVIGAATAFVASQFIEAEEGEEDSEEKKKRKEALKMNDSELNQISPYVGLPNLGNTCYMNSLVQFLSSSPEYVSYIEKVVKHGVISEYRSKIDPEDEEKLMRVDLLNNFIMLVLQLHYNDKEANPKLLYELLCSERFTRLFEECDAHELNCYIQDKISELIPKPKAVKAGSPRSDSGKKEGAKAMSVEEVEATSNKSGEAEPKVELSHLSPEELAQLENPFKFMTKSIIECQTCKNFVVKDPKTGKVGSSQRHLIFRKEENLDLDLQIPDSDFGLLPSGQVLIEELLDNYFHRERINQYYCIKCTLRAYLMEYVNEDLSSLKDLEADQKEDLLLTHQQIQWVNIPLEKEGQVLNDKDRTDFISSLDFFHRVYKTEDVDEEEFAERFKKFKLLSGNKCEHELSRQKVEIMKWKVMSQLPKVLGVHINRLCYDNFGNQFLDRRFVDFPEVLDFKKKRSGLATSYLDSSEEVPDKKFKLYGVIEHMGQPSFGHYIAAKNVIKLKDESLSTSQTPTGNVIDVKTASAEKAQESDHEQEGQEPVEEKEIEGKEAQGKEETEQQPSFSDDSKKVWVLCNDNVTKEIRLDQVLSSKAYMLLYRRIDE